MHPGELVHERYALEELIGRGGMAEVWCAIDQRLDRKVAIKFLAPGMADDPEFLVRLFNEARSVAGISHPNVTAVLDYGSTDDGPYLVMEYVSGGSLSDLTGEALEPTRAVGIMAQVASGAGAAHVHGIVHRDIKPGNILLAEDGTVKLADFGIASSEVGANLTATGAAIGSPSYISPEQAMGHTVTPRADIYSMGIVLYQLLTGQLPFAGGNPTAIAISQVEDTALPPSHLIPGLDPHLDALVMRCLEKDPDARFTDGNALAAALAGEEIAIHEPQTAMVPVVAAGASVSDAAGTETIVTSTASEGTRSSMAARSFWNLRNTAGAAVLLLALVAIGIHLISQPSVAEPKPTAPHTHNGSPSTHAKPGVTPTAGTTTPAATASPSPTPTPSPDKKNHRGKPKDPGESPVHHKKPKDKPSPRPTTSPAPSPTAAPTPTPSPTPTPAASDAAAPEPTPSL